ncbi:MAG: P1 family peptidase [Christensenellales bacterium]|jgi:L-aminopeptidase/D-esterase-like protein
MYKGSITQVSGIRVGHSDDPRALTGCSVVICEEGATAGVSVRGASPGTRETDVARDGNMVERVNAVMLCGGSAFGLDACSGAMRFLEENAMGYDTGDTVVPIVMGAVIYDLNVGSCMVRPDARMGYEACENADDRPEMEQGAVGAGMGATVGKALGTKGSMPGGIGTASLHLGGGVVVGALVVVNAMGDVVDEYGDIIAGARLPDGRYLDTWQALCSGMAQDLERSAGTNTTIGVVATNAELTRAQAQRMAECAHDGMAMAIRPVHTMVDGDTIFGLSTGTKHADMIILCTAAAEVTARAIRNAIEALGE